MLCGAGKSGGEIERGGRLLFSLSQAIAVRQHHTMVVWGKKRRKRRRVLKPLGVAKPVGRRRGGGEKVSVKAPKNDFLQAHSGERSHIYTVQGYKAEK